MLHLSLFVVLVGLLDSSLGLDKELDDAWVNFKQVYSKDYTQDIELLRRLIWEENVRTIQRHNLEADRGVHAFHMGENEYSDMSSAEFRTSMNGFVMTNQTTRESNMFHSNIDVSALPSTVDWRDKGYVTDIKNQGQCGSCWAFSATGALEGQNFKKTGKLVSLSEQNLVDCSKKQGNQGCQGGLPSNAFTYIKDNKGVDTEDSYPYKAKNGKCKFASTNIGATDKGYKTVFKGFEYELQKAVAEIGPISIGMDASHGSFQQYKSGIYSEKLCSRSRLDHGVLVVGYGSQNGEDYWIVKNSWGTSWGMKGYFLLARNEHNMCGVATSATYPIV